MTQNILLFIGLLADHFLRSFAHLIFKMPFFILNLVVDVSKYYILAYHVLVPFIW